MDIFACLLTALTAYLLGSIPTGFLVGKAKGIDIRTVGSGNIGATNAMRTLGKGPGIFVLVADALKGWLAAYPVPQLVHHLFKLDWDVEYLQIIAGIVVILGHNYTCWLKFKGGKGIATSAGLLIALMPFAFVVALATWIIFCLLTRYVSVASIAAALVLPFGAWAGHSSYAMLLVATVLSALAIYKHKPNIERLLNGTENKLGRKKSPPGTIA